LKKILIRLALSDDEIRNVPNNYVAAVASDTFPRRFNEDRPDNAYLPTDLLKPDGSWICLTGGQRNEVAAFEHVKFFAGRSTFLMFLRLPGGREKTREYLRNLNLFPQPWVVRKNSVIRARSGPASGQLRRNDVLQFNPKLPQFPVGTEVAFVRQMMAIGSDGNIVATPLTQSVQLRYYRRIGELPFSELGTTQVFHEWKLSRKRLFAGKTGGLHIEDDRQPALRSLQFVTGFSDPFESDELARHLTPKGNLCNACHSGETVRSINTFARAAQRSRLKGPVLADTTPETERHRTIDWKQTQHEWGLFQGLLEKGASTN
jgi:hypothetical protein